jgi:hypothetical protein
MSGTKVIALNSMINDEKGIMSGLSVSEAEITPAGPLYGVDQPPTLSVL